jgi:hypothetical protein
MARVFEEAEKAAHALADEQDRAGSLAVLTKVLAQAEQYDRALQIADSIKVGWRRVQTLMYIAGAFERAGDERASAVMEDARRVKGAIQDSEELLQAERVSILALRDMGCFDRAETAALAIQDADERATEMRYLVTALLQNQLLERARKVASCIETKQRDQALNDVALALISSGRFDEALEVVCEIEAEKGQTMTLLKLGMELKKAGDERAQYFVRL